MRISKTETQRKVSKNKLKDYSTFEGGHDINEEMIIDQDPIVHELGDDLINLGFWIDENVVDNEMSCKKSFIYVLWLITSIILLIIQSTVVINFYVSIFDQSESTNKSEKNSEFKLNLEVSITKSNFMFKAQKLAIGSLIVSNSLNVFQSKLRLSLICFN